MNSLKAALGKEEKKIDKLMSNMSVSRNKFSNSKSQSMWAFQNDDKNVQISLDNDQKLDLLNKLLMKAYEKDHHISSVTFDRIVQDFQQQMNSSPNKSQLSYYLVLEDKMTDLIDIFAKPNPQYTKYLEAFHQNVEQRIQGLRNKDKTILLKNFDKIAGVNNNFKKKTDYLDVGGLKFDANPRSKEKSKQQHNSNQKKLNRLLSKEKDFKEKQAKKQPQQQDHDDYFLSQTIAENNQSVSYSAIMSSSVAVKQRRPRKRSTKPDEFNFNKNEAKNKKGVQNQQQGQKTDKAFIFFRPRKTSKY